MAQRINRAIELLAQDQAIYYVGGHSGHVLTRAQGREDAGTWADYINVGMEHGAFDMTGLGEYMAGLVEGGPTRSGHRSPTVIVEAPVNGTDAANVRFNAWQFRQILGRGVHGVLLCQAEIGRRGARLCRSLPLSASLAPVSTRPYPPPLERMHGAVGARAAACSASAPAAAAPRRRRRRSGASRPRSISTAANRGRSTRAANCCSASSSNRPEGIAQCEAILAVPGLGFAELGPGDLGLSLGYVAVPRQPYPPEMREARERVFAACRNNRVAFLETGSPETICTKLDEGVRVIAGYREETSTIGRAHQRRTMPV